MVTQGAQQAFDLIGRVLIAPGTSVAVEDPGYSRVRLLYRSLGARVVGVPVDDEGLVVDAIPRRARLVYVTPSHQFPLGTTMSLGHAGPVYSDVVGAAGTGARRSRRRAATHDRVHHQPLAVNRRAATGAETAIQHPHTRVAPGLPRPPRRRRSAPRPVAERYAPA